MSQESDTLVLNLTMNQHHSPGNCNSDRCTDKALCYSIRTSVSFVPDAACRFEMWSMMALARAESSWSKANCMYSPTRKKNRMNYRAQLTGSACKLAVLAYATSPFDMQSSDRAHKTDR